MTTDAQIGTTVVLAILALVTAAGAVGSFAEARSKSPSYLLRNDTVATHRFSSAVIGLFMTGVCVVCLGFIVAIWTQ